MMLKYKKGVLAKKLEMYARKDPNLARVLEYTKSAFDKSGLSAHNWAHAYRDVLNAIVIGEGEEADMKIILPAAAMHDVGFLYGGTGQTHEDIGAQKLKSFLDKGGIKYSKEDILRMAGCIRTHKGSMFGKKPQSLEAKVVCDADFLEKFGPFGVYQTVRTYTEFNWEIKKLLKRAQEIPHWKLETKTGKKIAEQGRKFVIDFYTHLKKANDLYES